MNVTSWWVSKWRSVCLITFFHLHPWLGDMFSTQLWVSCYLGPKISVLHFLYSWLVGGCVLLQGALPHAQDSGYFWCLVYWWLFKWEFVFVPIMVSGLQMGGQLIASWSKWMEVWVFWFVVWWLRYTDDLDDGQLSMSLNKFLVRGASCYG